MSRTHPECVDASPFVIAEDELDETKEGRVFFGRQFAKVHHGVWLKTEHTPLHKYRRRKFEG